VNHADGSCAAEGDGFPRQHIPARGHHDLYPFDLPVIQGGGSCGKMPFERLDIRQHSPQIGKGNAGNQAGDQGEGLLLRRNVLSGLFSPGGAVTADFGFALPAGFFVGLFILSCRDWD